MKRRLSFRERVLLAILAVLLLTGGYAMLFYMPQTAAQERSALELEDLQTQIDAARLRLVDMRRMEQELKELAESDKPPRKIADYDNLQSIMIELNSILAKTKNFSLTFSTADSSQPIVRRDISINFTAKNYKTAKEILQLLHDSNYRCMLDSVSLNLEQGADSPVMVNGVIAFFEYQPNPPEQNSTDSNPGENKTSPNESETNPNEISQHEAG